MITLRAVCVFLALFISGSPAAEPAQPPVSQINDVLAKSSLDYFKRYLSGCSETQIRCIWFLEDNIRIGMIMEMDLREGTVFTVREVFSHASQNSRTRGMSDYQRNTAEKLLAHLPLSTSDVPFPQGVHISFWREKKLQTVTYSKKAAPLLVQRLYDVGGGDNDFTYASGTTVTPHKKP